MIRYYLVKPKFILFLLAASLLGTGCKQIDPATAPVVYHNADYGLTFTLPADWRGYTVLMQKWEGSSYRPAHDPQKTVARGPLIILRHPQWTSEHPRQDIPIEVFTCAQWELVHAETINLHAGGIDEEIEHNSRYVFAIYSRFAAGELTGSEEAGKIVEQNQKANEPHLYAE